MKKIILIALLLLLFASNAYADAFQFFARMYNNVVYAAYSKVEVLHPNGAVVFRGYTDKYGRININIPRGKYNCEVVYSNIVGRVSLIIDGYKGLKPININ